MGLAPMHTWKPDAYGEAPGLVGALLAGAVTNAAFLALLRVYRIVDAGGQGEFARQLMVTMGLLSMAWAAVFLVRQRDFKRMLGYSSVEHMGILVLGVGIGGAGMSAALLHTANNGLAKVVMFLTAANIHRAFGSKLVSELPGVIRQLPVSAILFLCGFLAATGSPPFGSFVSLFGVARASIGGGRWFVGGAFLLLLFAVFAGMGATVLDVAYRVGSTREARFRDRAGTTLAPAVALFLLVVLGVALPPQLSALIGAAARALTGTG
jgi:hydrogenase-4 component F